MSGHRKSFGIWTLWISSEVVHGLSGSHRRYWVTIHNVKDPDIDDTLEFKSYYSAKKFIDDFIRDLKRKDKKR